MPATTLRQLKKNIGPAEMERKETSSATIRRQQLQSHLKSVNPFSYM